MILKLTKELMDICNVTLDDEASQKTVYGVNVLSKEQRILIEEKLIEHFEFRKVIWISLPVAISEEGKKVNVLTFKADAQTNKYPGKVAYVYTISFTTKIYDPSRIRTPVKDGCVISPVIYDPVNFEPYRSITLTWNPEKIQDMIVALDKVKILKQHMHDLLDKVLDNEKEYLPEASIYGMIRFAVE